MHPRILRLPEVMRTVGLKHSSIYKLVSLKQFPQPIRLSPRAVGWRASDVEAWIKSRPLAHPDQGGER